MEVWMGWLLKTQRKESKMYWVLRWLLLSIYFFSPLTIAKNQFVYYEPKSVELNGTIKTLKFPGPPNYESIKNGDVNETGSYLILNNPINVRLAPNVQIGNDEAENNVKIIQLVVNNDNDWKNVKEGNYVHVTGTLFHALTGHHHARILLLINKIKVFSSHKKFNKKLDITTDDRQFLKYQYVED